MDQKNIKYVGEYIISYVIGKCKESFALKSHNHKLSEIEGYKLDSELSANSNNPLTNKAITEKFNFLQSQIDGMADYEFITTADIDAICGTTIQNTLTEEVLF